MALRSSRRSCRTETVRAVAKEGARDQRVAPGQHRQHEQLVPEDVSEIALPMQAPSTEANVTIDDVW